MNIKKEEPAFVFYEEGDWLRIEAQGQPTRYLKKELAMQAFIWIGKNSVREKNDFLILR